MDEARRARLVAQLRAGADVAFADAPVAFAYVFGSRVAGRPRPDSDIDIAVMFTDQVLASDHLAATLSLADALQRVADVGVIEAVVDLATAPLALAGRVLRDGVVIHSADDVARIRHFSDTLRRFGDWELHQRRHVHDRLAAIAEPAHG